MEQLLSPIFSLFKTIFWGIEDLLSGGGYTRISFIIMGNHRSNYYMSNGECGTNALSYCTIVNHMKESFGSKCPIQFDYSSFEFKDFFLGNGTLLSYISWSEERKAQYNYDYLIKRFNGFVVDLEGQKRISESDLSQLETLLRYFQADDRLVYNVMKPEKAKSSYHRPILFIFTLKEDTWDKNKTYPTRDELIGQLEELIERTQYDPAQYNITFVYHSSYSKKLASDEEQFYASLEWLFRKSVNKDSN